MKTWTTGGPNLPAESKLGLSWVERVIEVAVAAAIAALTFYLSRG